MIIYFFAIISWFFELWLLDLFWTLFKMAETANNEVTHVIFVFTLS